METGRTPETIPSQAPFGAYFHIPWCRRRCPYCDFYIELGKPTSGFLPALAAEMAARQAEVNGIQYTSVYFGGGTPTALAPEKIVQIIKECGDYPGLAPNAEITVEANPEDLTPQVCEILARGGVNRISLGIQSFQPETIRFLGRAHDGAQAKRAIAAAAVMERVSVDLIAGVPGDEPSRLERDIETIAAHDVGHVSSYLLTVEEGTTLKERIQKGLCKNIDADDQADVYEMMRESLAHYGYRQYEISSHGKRGHESAHNRVYWSQGTYVGYGPGAHSMRILPDGSVLRRQNVPSLNQWLGDPAGKGFEEDQLSSQEALGEALAFGLRDLDNGIVVQQLETRHQAQITPTQKHALNGFVAQGWLVGGPDHYRLSQAGVLFADAVARDLL
jgi:oxygen-independent coproporphyrinogen III oxidase